MEETENEETENEEAEDSTREKIGSYIFTAVVFLPALITTGFIPLGDMLSPWAWTGIAVAGGAVGGAVYGEKRPLVYAVCGALAGFGVLGAMQLYVPFRAQFSDTFWKIEFVIPFVVGSIPAFVLLWAVTRSDRESDPSS